MHATKPYCSSPTYPKMCLISSFDSLKIGQDISFFCFRVAAETSGSNLLYTSSSILSSSKLKRGCPSTSLVNLFRAASTRPLVLSPATVIVLHVDFCLLLSGSSLSEYGSLALLVVSICWLVEILNTISVGRQLCNCNTHNMVEC